MMSQFKKNGGIYFIKIPMNKTKPGKFALYSRSEIYCLPTIIDFNI